MMLTLFTETVIDSCHMLSGYDGLCKNMHGHSWLIKLWFKGDSKYKDEVGILVDFGIVKELKEWLDHQYINDKIIEQLKNIGYKDTDYCNPTAENLSHIIYNFLTEKINNKEIQVKVRIYETAVLKKTYCECGDFE
jgi:6-pyruvoyltetrahydropterin/6-carboxytetrahydropterin synthase